MYLEELEPDRTLYLAIPNDIYHIFFKTALFKK
ncbi:MAG: element excision factor XisH family protein [Crocosphaera sp.]